MDVPPPALDVRELGLLAAGRRPWARVEVVPDRLGLVQWIGVAVVQVGLAVCPDERDLLCARVRAPPDGLRRAVLGVVRVGAEGQRLALSEAALDRRRNDGRRVAMQRRRALDAAGVLVLD